jgi:hypothetical protein
MQRAPLPGKGDLLIGRNMVSTGELDEGGARPSRSIRWRGFARFATAITS